MECGYCHEPIAEGEPYQYKWFPAQKLMLPTHVHHLEITKNLKKGTPYVAE